MLEIAVRLDQVLVGKGDRLWYEYDFGDGWDHVLAVAEVAVDLDEHVEQFRLRPLDAAGPFTFAAADALTMKVREGSRVINTVVLLVTRGVRRRSP